MNASKENARQASQHFDKIMAGGKVPEKGAYAFIYDFLKAAERKLPSEEAFAKDKMRRKTTMDELVANSNASELKKEADYQKGYAAKNS